MKATTILLLTLGLFGCGGDPCEEYCRTFIEKTQSCNLGGPTGDSVVQQCSDQITITDAQCSDATPAVENMSCTDFRTLVCEQSGASSVYNCP